ncbi:hypothetical protein [Nocardia nova]|uniref:hypothetical protein n=1 Tax=Nocardia nova TaxID=37330 RepID=UPI0011AFD3AC|nr:hypothetical protein [Nocardia nova]
MKKPLESRSGEASSCRAAVRNRPNSKAPQPNDFGPSAWSWPLVVLIVLLVLMALVFAIVLFLRGVAPVVATGLGVVVVVSIVACVVPRPSSPGVSILRRALRALATFAGGNPGQGLQ